MSNDKDKQYCVIDHANKQRDRDRRYPGGRAAKLQRHGVDYCAEPGACGDAHDDSKDGND